MKNHAAIVTERLLPLLIFIASFIYFSSGNEKTAVFMVDEARNSECAREMYEKGDMIVPTFNYELRTDKPPLHYWFMMAAYSVFGVNAFAARFFSAVFGAFTLLLTFYAARRYLGLKQALFAVLILLASLNLALEFHLAVPDPYFIFFVTAALLSLFNFFVNRKFFPLFLAYVCTGLAVLAKGPVTFVLIGMSGLFYLIIKKEFSWNTIKQLRPITGLIIISAIILPWFIRVGKATNWRWQDEFIFEHNLDRYAGTMEGHGGFWGLTIAYVLLAFLPFAVFLIQSFREAFRKRRENDLLLFSLVSSLVIILFFSFSATKLPNYAMPAYPFIAIILGNYFTLRGWRQEDGDRRQETGDRRTETGDRRMETGDRRQENGERLSLLLIINLIISISVPVGIYYVIKSTPEVMPLIHFAWLFVLIPLSALAALWIWKKYRYFRGVIIAISSGWIMTSMLCFLWLLPSLSRLDPVQQAIPDISDSKNVGYYRRFNQAFPFYLRKPIQKLDSREDVENFFRKYPDACLITAAQFSDELKNLPLKEIIKKKDLFENPVTIVYRFNFLSENR